MWSYKSKCFFSTGVKMKDELTDKWHVCLFLCCDSTQNLQRVSDHRSADDLTFTSDEKKKRQTADRAAGQAYKTILLLFQTSTVSPHCKQNHLLNSSCQMSGSEIFPIFTSESVGSILKQLRE